MKIDQQLNQIIKDLVKAVSIYITQIFSVVTFYNILFANYFSDQNFKHIIVLFAIFFTAVFLGKSFLHVNELIVRIKEIKPKQSKTGTAKQNAKK